MRRISLESMIHEVVHNSMRCRNCGELTQDHYWVYYVPNGKTWGAGYKLRCPHIKNSYYAKNQPG